jgi:DNA-binding SARP family transcriptional activator
MTARHARRPGQAATSLLCFLVLAGLTGGLPAGLYAAGGSPIPHAIPSVHQVMLTLSRPDNGTLVLAAVRWASWLAWAAFTVSVAAEAAAVLRGHPAWPVPGITPLQGLAAVLVSAIIAGTTAVPAVAQVTAPPAAAVAPPRATPPQPGPAVMLPAVYRVAPGDNLWTVAETYLGNGEAWHQIWALNKDRPQPGGGQLTIPGLIQPGWLLRLPAPGRGHPAPGPPQPRQQRPRPPAGHPPRPCPPLLHPARPAQRGQPGPGVSLPSGSLASAGLAAAVAAALTLAAVHRRRRYQPGGPLNGRGDPPVPHVPRPVAALRRAAGAAAPGQEVPGADDKPQGPQTGPPGLVTPDPVGLPVMPPDAEDVAMGVRDGREICADLATFGGLGLTGPGAPAAARAILAAVLSRVLPGSAHGGADVILPAADARLLLGGNPAGAPLPGLTLAPSLDAALEAAEVLVIRRTRLAGHETSGSGAAQQPPAVLLATPAQAATRRLAGIARAGQTTGLAVIMLGHWPAGTSCRVDADGIAASTDPGLDGTRLFSLTTADAGAVIAVLRQACAPSPEPPLPAPTPAQPPAPAPAPGPAARPLPAPPAAPDSRILRVDVLGPLRITARGSEITSGLRKARELAAYLAVHPGGATPEAITEALWPDSAHGDSQRALALRKLRDLLRHAAGMTEPRMVQLSAGRYRLDPSLISTDYADFHTALDAARQAATPEAQLAACRRATSLYRGPLADGAGYDWAEPAAEITRRRVLDAWTRIAEILQPAHPDQALTALDGALSHDPYNEYLYQRIMSLQAAAGQPDAARRTLCLLETRLAEIGLTPSSQTRQTAARLLADPAGTGTSPSRSRQDQRPPGSGSTPGPRPA